MSKVKFEVDDNHLKNFNDLKYLELLATQYPDIQSASTEIINLQAILNLPKGTEFFLSDLHGEYEAFIHMLKSASGVVKHKVKDVFSNTLNKRERNSLATLIYYPEEKLNMIKFTEENLKDWYKVTLYRLIMVLRVICSKYTRSKVRKALPKDFDYIIEELLHEGNNHDKEDYYNQIIKTIINIDRADHFIVAISKLIQKLAVDRLHILGDIFDRGPGSDIIMDALMEYNEVDIQWGNHDISWIGAAAGCEACIANVIRIASRYCNLDTIRDGYGINLLPLATLAMEYYSDDPCEAFLPKQEFDEEYNERDHMLTARMHKAISIIQFKLESQIIKRRFLDDMKDSLLLDKIDYEKGVITIGNKQYTLKDNKFPTINKENPYELTKEELNVVNKLKNSFLRSEKLQRHVQFLFAKGGMYKVYNSNLLFHGCILLDEKGDFLKVKIGDEYLSGKEYIDKLEDLAINAYFNKKNNKEKQLGLDYLWYLWAGPYSPLFGKNKMATFERYFIEDKESHKEIKNKYYELRDDEMICKKILKEFDLDENTSHIINGHVPVASKKGENPVKANGKLLVIDGGMSKTYHAKTGIAGYTLISNSYGLIIISHQAFESTISAIEKEKDIISSSVIVEKLMVRKKVADTDIGEKLKEEIEYLELLLEAYTKGLIK